MKAVIAELLEKVTPELRDVIERAYEQGYRDALAGGDPASPVSAGGEGAVAPAASAGLSRLADDSAPPAATGKSLAQALWGDKPADEAEDDPTDGHERKPRRRLGILPGSTIGRLRDRIFQEFRLDRFALDIVICRTGDRERRQLPSHASLSAYLLEE